MNLDTLVMDKAVLNSPNTRKMDTKNILNRAPGSPVVQKVNAHNSNNSTEPCFATSKDKLEFCAQQEGFQILYNDFVKVCEGSGDDV